MILFDPSRAESFVAGFHLLQERSADLAVGRRLQAGALRNFGPASFGRVSGTC